jgi:hypothetical protein
MPAGVFGCVFPPCFIYFVRFLTLCGFQGDMHRVARQLAVTMVAQWRAVFAILLEFESAFLPSRSGPHLWEFIDKFPDGFYLAASFEDSVLFSTNVRGWKVPSETVEMAEFAERLARAAMWKILWLEQVPPKSLPVLEQPGRGASAQDPEEMMPAADDPLSMVAMVSDVSASAVENGQDDVPMETPFAVTETDMDVTMESAPVDSAGTLPPESAQAAEPEIAPEMEGTDGEAAIPSESAQGTEPETEGPGTNAEDGETEGESKGRPRSRRASAQRKNTSALNDSAAEPKRRTPVAPVAMPLFVDPELASVCTPPELGPYWGRMFAPIKDLKLLTPKDKELDKMRLRPYGTSDAVPNSKMTRFRKKTEDYVREGAGRLAVIRPDELVRRAAAVFCLENSVLSGSPHLFRRVVSSVPPERWAPEVEGVVDALRVLKSASLPAGQSPVPLCRENLWDVVQWCGEGK